MKRQGSQGAEEKGEKTAVPERDEGEKITPVARRFAEAQKVDWAQMKGAGANNRMMKRNTPLRKYVNC